MMTDRQKYLIKKNLMGWAFCLAPLVLFIVFVVVPLVMAFYLSFTDYNLISYEWVGLKNYETLFGNDAMRTDFLISLKNVGIYTLISLPLSIFPPMFVAGLLNNGLRGSKTFRVLLYIPALSGSVAMALIWGWFFDVARSPINYLLTSIGLEPLMFLTSPDSAMLTLIVIVTWSGTGGGVIMFTAAMQTIPGEYYEAARVDGASGFVQFFKITMPLLRPTVFFLFTMGIISSLQLFDPVYLLTNGGPERATQTPAYLIYVNSFQTSRKAGYGSAIAVVFFFIVMAVTFLFQKFTKEEVF
ncbi:MAG: carbohydrate ABC transporter permease [Christensenellales bacterium]